MKIKLPILSKAFCPKCRSKRTARVASDDKSSDWKCEVCGHFFKVGFLKLQKSV